MATRSPLKDPATMLQNAEPSGNSIRTRNCYCVMQRIASKLYNLLLITVMPQKTGLSLWSVLPKDPGLLTVLSE